MTGAAWLLIGLCAAVVAAWDPMEDPNLFQGDMVLTKQQKEDYLEGKANSAVPLAALKNGLWPKVIPYIIHSSLLSQPKATKAIEAAIEDYRKYTCLSFVPRTDQKGYIEFYRGGGCSSPVGYFGKRNRISLSSGCWHKGTVIHEIAHSLGFYHEQSRPDRDEYVIIHWDNIRNGMQFNFEKQKSENIDSMSVPYDYESIMHYGKSAFGSGKITIETRDKSKQSLIGRRSGFSQYDILQMNLLYSCPGFTRPPPGVKPTGTKVPGVTTNEACYDSFKDCQSWQNQGMCTQSKWKKFMSEKCRLSCGFCGGVTTAKPDGDCHDKIECTSLVVRGYCTRRFVDYMKTNCAKSCNFCISDDVVNPPLAVLDDCADIGTSCAYYAKFGYCTKVYVDYMKRNCQKTCGFCSGGRLTTPKPKPPTRPPVTGSCGRPEIQQGRVISGVDAKKGAWPWQILMLYNDRPMCGGSLVAPNWVVTAAHCVSGRAGRSFKIRLGEHITSTTSDGRHTEIQVEKVIAHPSYTRRTLDSDIAVMKLSRPATFGKYVKPVCLPGKYQDVPEGTECFITGWGKIRHPGNMHYILQQGKMPVVSNGVCRKLNTKNMRIEITENMVCAGHGGTTRVSGCHGDSGGPFVCKTGQNGQWELHGAVSWGNGRCDATKGYTVFARVTKFREWIDKQMAEN